MKSGKTLLVAVRDEATAAIALQRAVLMADSPADRIHLVHGSDRTSWHRVAELLAPEWRIPDAPPHPDPYAWLHQLSASSAAGGRTVSVDVLDGDPGSAIVAHARQVRADLIIVAPPRGGLIHELLLGSTALQILRTASCPILVAREANTAPYTNALVAVDIDESGDRVTQVAATWLPDARIDLMHGYRVPEEGLLRMDGYPEHEIDRLLGLIRADAERRLAPYRSRFGHASLHLEHGFASTVLLDGAQRLGANVVVLGRHRGSVRNELTVGSVAQFMLYNCPSDMLLVP